MPVLWGEMPPYYQIPYAIWGQGCNFDSDGDADHSESVEWRKLDASLRPALKELISIHDPTNDRDLLLIQATSEIVFNKAIQFLIDQGDIVLLEKD